MTSKENIIKRMNSMEKSDKKKQQITQESSIKSKIVKSFSFLSYGSNLISSQLYKYNYYTNLLFVQFSRDKN